MAAEALLIVYIARNLLNGKVYIGQTSRGLKQRRSEHFCVARLGSNTYFHKAIRRYGEHNFKFEILYIAVSYGHLNMLEEMAIGLYNARNPKFGYNLAEGGGSSRGFKMSRQARTNLSRIKKGHTPWNKGKKFPGLGNRLGCKHSIESRRKMSLAKRGKSPARWIIDKAIRMRKKNAERRRLAKGDS